MAGNCPPGKPTENRRCWPAAGVAQKSVSETPEVLRGEVVAVGVDVADIRYVGSQPWPGTLTSAAAVGR